ncbi:MAG: c-type cytochrome [Lentisphaeraceae bacterium]|nr:c-type cytochrome [Lentisphaeraceae bacterium]
MQALLKSNKSTALRLRALWTLRLIKAVDESSLKTLLSDKDENIRLWAMRILVDEKLLSSNLTSFLQSVAKNEPSQLVKLFAISYIAQVPAAQGLKLAITFSQDASLNDDKQYPQLLWSTIESNVIAKPEAAYALFSATKLTKLKVWIARRLIYESKNEKLFNELLPQLKKLSDEPLLQVLASIDRELKAKQRHIPPTWEKLTVDLAKRSHKIQKTLASISLKFTGEKAYARLLKIAIDHKAPIRNRRFALKQLAKTKESKLLLQVLKDEKSLELHSEALLELRQMNYPQTAELVIAKLKTAKDKKVYERIIISKEQWAAALLKAIENAELPVKALSASGAQQISLISPKLKARLQKVWGTVNLTAKGVEKEISQWTAKLNKTLKKGRITQGKQVFRNVCAACHTLFGEGGKIGPELGGADRANLNYLLTNIIDPNLIVPDNYKLTTITLKDGRILSGFTSKLGRGLIELKSAGGKEVIKSKDILKLQKSQ